MEEIIRMVVRESMVTRQGVTGATRGERRIHQETMETIQEAIREAGTMGIIREEGASRIMDRERTESISFGVRSKG